MLNYCTESHPSHPSHPSHLGHPSMSCACVLCCEFCDSAILGFIILHPSETREFGMNNSDSATATTTIPIELLKYFCCSSAMMVQLCTFVSMAPSSFYSCMWIVRMSHCGSVLVVVHFQPNPLASFSLPPHIPPSSPFNYLHSIDTQTHRQRTSTHNLSLSLSLSLYLSLSLSLYLSISLSLYLSISLAPSAPSRSSFPFNQPSVYPSTPQSHPPSPGN